MMCPILTQHKDDKYEVDCQEDKCAWWCKHNCCSILVIGNLLSELIDRRNQQLKEKP